jgi:hypothetical protein
MSHAKILRAVATALLLSVVAFRAGPSVAQTPPPPLLIEKLSNVNDSGKLLEGAPRAGLTDYLAVILKLDRSKLNGLDPKTDPGSLIDTGKVVLLLDGRPIYGLNDTRYRADTRALIFHLERTSENADGWQSLLDSPGLTPRGVAVALWPSKPQNGGPAPAMITAADNVQPTFDLYLMNWTSLSCGVVFVLIALVVVLAKARRSGVLKDSLLPQLAPKEQPYSLGRVQMAFWFVLIFASYVFLYILLWDHNTLTSQALMLMGISSATAVFAVAIDQNKDSPIGKVSETLRAMGINTYDDVVKLKQQADDPATPQATKLDCQTKLRTWRDLTGKYKSEGFYRDLVTDVNGPALHRLQVLVWTVALSVVFLIDVYRTLRMPEFSTTLLALMGVTSAGYLGFKYPEKQG